MGLGGESNDNSMGQTPFGGGYNDNSMGQTPFGWESNVNYGARPRLGGGE